MKRVKNEPIVLGRVCGLDWSHWIASEKEGLTIRIVADWMGEWLTNSNNGLISEKRKTLQEAFRVQSTQGMKEFDFQETKNYDHFFVEISLFSADDFQTGWSTAIHHHKAPKQN